MTNSSAIDFLSPVSVIKGIGPRRMTAMRESGIETVGDLLYWFPRRYIDRSDVVSLREVPEWLDKTCTTSGVVEKARIERGRRGKGRLRVLLVDGEGSLELLWFAGIRMFQSVTAPGSRLLVTGKVALKSHFQMAHPLVERLSDGASSSGISSLPIYPLTDEMREAGIGHRFLTRCMEWVFDAKPHYPQVIPPDIEKRSLFPPLETCLREIHRPSDVAQLDRFLDRLRYEELYRLALTLRFSRRAFAKAGRSLLPGDLPLRFRQTLPFVLTNDQEEAVSVLFKDAASSRRMHRLLQGDVGSGKTIVAFFACLPALASGCQAAWLAPTEVLAVQSFKVIEGWLASLGMKPHLLKQGIDPRKRRETIRGLASGEVRFVVGTHALLEPSVVFGRLGMIVIDEQHRFGAAQRLVMQEKDPASDFLLMSATPIPQTLAKTLYGDLDIVTIRHAPKGRLAVETRVVPEEKREAMERFIRAEIVDSGASVYYVVPRIEPDGEDGELRDAESMLKELSRGTFADIPMANLHGRMKSEEKIAAMEAFVGGSVKLLISTTVIEVGVDVPAATIIVIENAERFGLAQLHQLRGRVGRGGGESWCFLLAGSADDAAQARLSFFCGSHDGFAIADKDLSLRGPGEVAGMRQTGWDDLRLADMLRDAPLFREIQEEIETHLRRL